VGIFVNLPNAVNRDIWMEHTIDSVKKGFGHQLIPFFRIKMGNEIGGMHACIGPAGTCEINLITEYFLKAHV
jgi:hypothetical protein